MISGPGGVAEPEQQPVPEGDPVSGLELLGLVLSVPVLASWTTDQPGAAWVTAPATVWICVSWVPRLAGAAVARIFDPRRGVR